jgi:hypothetical protein
MTVHRIAPIKRNEPPPELVNVLLPAFAPCAGFAGACKDHTLWNPPRGWVPRGFRGAFGTIAEIKLVLVCAEPGNAYADETHDGPTPLDKLRSAYTKGNLYIERPADQFARNLRTILNYAWPGQTFDQQMHKTWLTESVLCSAAVEGGAVPFSVELECADRYLIRQLSLFPDARVVALGRKAQNRLARIGVSFVPAWAAAPPGCNRREAPESWRRAVTGLS